jgi:hypothetical protein
LAEAKRLGLKIGLHNTPGYATTGGPWITEERGMQTVVVNKRQVTGNRLIDEIITIPELPTYLGIQLRHPDNPYIGRRQGTYYKDIAVMAVPLRKGLTVKDIVDITPFMDASGRVKWQAPEGVWMICRIGHAPTMSTPHPVPDDIIDNSLEVDKMSREANIFHWQQVLNPLKEHFKEYIGNTFTFIWIDSYEAEDQDWTPLFREDFIRLKGYDPVPWIALQQVVKQKGRPFALQQALQQVVNKETAAMQSFENDYKEVINSLFIYNGW